MKTKVSILAILVLLASLIGGCASMDGSRDAGDLDGWGFNGRWVFTMQTSPGTAETFILQPDGMILAVGIINTGNDVVVVERLTGAGFLDFEFANSGALPINFCDSTVICTYSNPSLAAGKNGSFYVASTVEETTDTVPLHYIAVASFDQAGVQDLGFGINGLLTTREMVYPTAGATFSQVDALAVDGKDNLLLAGTLQPPEVTEPPISEGIILRFTPQGLLDSKFGTAGRLIFNIGGNATRLYGLAVQDGKLLAAGSVAVESIDYPFVSRYTAKGGLDFATIVTTAGKFGSLAIAGDGSFYAAGGSADGDMLLAHFNSSGALDGSFGTGGLVTKDLFGQVDEMTALALQPDGKIVVAGAAAELIELETISHFVVLRYEPGGSPDTTFGEEGVLLTTFEDLPDMDYTFPLGSCAAGSLFILPGGRILAGGYGDDLQALGTSPAVALYEPTGELSGFGFLGLAASSMAGWGDSGSFLGGRQVFAVQSDGGIVQVVSDSGTTDSHVLLARLKSNGLIDLTFAPDEDPQNDPYAILDTAAADDEDPLVITDSSGRILVSWRVNPKDTSTPYYLGLARFSADGLLDLSFGSGDGIVTTNVLFPLDDFAAPQGLDLQSDGGVLVLTGIDGDPILLRYNTDGVLDTTFGEGGVVRFDLADTSQGFWAGMAVQPDGSILLAGTSMNSDIQAMVSFVRRYSPDGQTHEDFASPVPPQGSFLTGLFDILVQPSGVIYVVGATVMDSTENSDALLARYLPDGQLDPSFGNAGVLYTDFYGEEDLFFTAMVQPDGRIVAGGMAMQTIGTAPNTETYALFSLARFMPDGNLDASFGTDGKVALQIPVGTTPPMGLATTLGMHDGNILAAGVMGDFSSTAYSVLMQFVANLVHDDTPPVLAPAFSQKPPFQAGTLVSASANASDPESGIEYQSCGSIDTTTPGVELSVACQALNGAGNQTTVDLPYSVVGEYIPLLIAPETLADGNLGNPYSQQFSASGGTEPYLYEIIGTPPSGLSLSKDGLLSGTPTQMGSFPFTIQAQDAVGHLDAKDYSLTIGKGLPTVSISSSQNPSTQGAMVTFTVTVSGSDNITPTGRVEIPGYWSTDLVDGSAVFNLSDLALGSNLITANYSGDAYYLPRSAEITQVVNAVSADLGISIADGKDPVRVGTSLVYTLTITNYGPNAAQNVQVTDTLDVNTVYISFAGKGWTCNHASGVVTCTTGILASGASATIKITVSVPIGTIGPLSNSVEVTSSSTDLYTDNNSDIETTQVSVR